MKKYRKLTKEELINEYLDTALLAGRISLENGGETARSEDTMKYILESSGIEDSFADVTSTTLFASLGDKTKVSKISRWDNNLNKVCIVNSVSRNLCNGKTTIREAHRLLTKAQNDVIYPLWVRLGASMMTAALLPLFSGSNPMNCVAAIINGLIIGLAGEVFSHIHIRYFIVNIFQGLLMVLMTDLFAIVFSGMIDTNEVLAASIAPMLPGIALTNGVRDLLSGDYLSGAGRMMEALVKALSIALGVAAGLSLQKFYTIPVASAQFTIPGTLLIWLQIPAAYIIAVGYAVKMVNPVRSIWGSALVGAVGRLAFTFLMQFTAVSETIATFAATILIALMGNLMARRFKTPTIVYLISGIMCLVPGISLYQSVYGFVFGDMSQFRSQLVNTLLISGAIAVAVFFVDTGFNILTRAKNKTLFLK